MRQQLQCHVLERKGRPVEELQHMGIAVELLRRRNRGVIELGGFVGAGNCVRQFLRIEIIKIAPEDGQRAGAVVELGQRGNVRQRHLREHRRDIQAAIRRKTAQDGLGCRDAGAAAGGNE